MLNLRGLELELGRVVVLVLRCSWDWNLEVGFEIGSSDWIRWMGWRFGGMLLLTFCLFGECEDA